MTQTAFSQSEQMAYLGDFPGISAVAAGLLSIFKLRWSIIPPENMAILAIDGHLTSIPEEYYKTERSQRA